MLVLEYALFSAFFALALGTLTWALRRSRRGGRWIGWIWAVLVLLLVPGWVLTCASEREERQRLKKAVEGLAPTYADELRRMGHEHLELDTPPDDEHYKAMISRQIRWLELNDTIADIYTVRITSSGPVMVVDSETDYDKSGAIDQSREDQTPIGTPWPVEQEALAGAYAGKNCFQDEPYRDAWGVWVSAYAPMFDAEGKVEAVLGVDFPADDWIAALRRARWLAMGAISVLLVSVVSLITIIAVLRGDLAERAVREVQLRRAKEAAEAATLAKNMFIASVSHEIRTPMNGILGMSELLSSTTLSERQRGYLERIQSSSDVLLHLLNDVLDVSKIEAGRLEFEDRPFDPRALVEAVLESYRPRASSKGLELDGSFAADVPPALRGDPARLGQVFANLIANAIKFTDRGAVHVRVGAEPAGANEVQLQGVVQDTGIGIPADRQESIFEAFGQGDPTTTRRYGGTGLGLSICRLLVRALDGRIDVESEVGKGSTFTFTARFDVADAAAMEAEESARAGLDAPGSLDVLLVEDGRINQEVAVGLLELDGHRVTVVGDGAQAVEAVREHAYDVVLMDLQMPVLDGIGATSAIRKAEAGTERHVPIVAVTAIAMKGDRERCLRAGMDGYIAKPLDRAELRDVLARLGGPARPAAPPVAGDADPEDAGDLVGGADDDGHSVEVDPATMDWETALRRIPGGVAGVRRMAELMATEGPRLLGEIRSGLANGDAPRAGRGAHSLRSAADPFGAKALVAVAGEAEQLAREGRLDEMAGLVGRLEGLVADLTAVLDDADGPGGG